jgi:hypothetical protein
MADRLYALYLSRAARENLPIGLAAGQWGLTNDAVARKLDLPSTSLTGLEILEQLEIGDQVLAANGGPQPRVKRGGWASATLAEGSLWRVTTPYRLDTSEVWPAPYSRPQERWPHRFGIEQVATFRDLRVDRLGLAGMDAMHYSANVGGLPIPVEGISPVISTIDDLQDGETDDPGFLVLDGGLDAVALTSIRREQRKLRRTRFGDAQAAECVLCRQTLPVDCLRIAHVKKRSLCNEAERLDLNNIMAACSLGCDHLFELGYIQVDHTGIIRETPRPHAILALQRTIAALVGRRCAAHTKASERYFRWHREALSA